MTFEENYPNLIKLLFKNKNMGSEYFFNGEEEFDKLDISLSNFWLNQTSVEKYCFEKQRVKEAIDKHFVCGYEQGLSGAVHSINCRKCALLKELNME